MLKWPRYYNMSHVWGSLGGGGAGAEAVRGNKWIKSIAEKKTQETQLSGKTHPQPRSEAKVTIHQNYTI
jgi:hypothetical protein